MMHKSRDKKIRNLRNRSVVPHIIAFFLITIFFGIAAIMLTNVIVSYTAGRMLTECDKEVKTATAQINEKLDEGKDFAQIMDEMQRQPKRPMAVTIRKDGESIASYGEEIGESDLVLGNGKRVKLFVDLSPFYSMNRPALNDGDIKLNLEMLYENFYQNLIEPASEYLPSDYNDEAYFVTVDDVEEAIKQAENDYPELKKITVNELFAIELFRFDFWQEADLGRDGYSACVRQEFVITASDFAYVSIPITALFVIITIINIVQLCRTISTILNRRSFLRMLLQDSVTGGNNATAFEYYAERSIVAFRNRRLGYGILDLSISKYQNYCTLYGVNEGEKLLEQFDYVLRKNLRKGEYCARVVNGDFIVLLWSKNGSKSENELIYRATDLINNLSEKLSAFDGTRREVQGAKNLRFKGGLYYLPPVTDADSKNRRNRKVLMIDSLYIKAGMAKQNLAEDNGLAIYSHKMWEEEQWEQKVESLMQSALDNEEFMVYLQPKYHPATEKLSGAEALVRWISPTEGFISPGQFIPIFEKTGFVTKLDDYMVTHTAQLQAKWLAEGREIVPVSVNISRAHFAQADLAEHIRDLVDQYEVPHHFIEIELTESAFFDDKKALLSTVKRLQEYGFEVSMDDFGSGYSSLNSLKDLPLNVLKLDGEFFRGEEFGGRGEIVVSEAIALAKNLNMRIVAEGVEKKEQVDFLASQDCDMIQGYYFAKPMPAEEYAERIPIPTVEVTESNQVILSEED